jgi:hypothetical protein
VNCCKESCNNAEHQNQSLPHPPLSNSGELGDDTLLDVSVVAATVSSDFKIEGVTSQSEYCVSGLSTFPERLDF